MKNKLKKTWSKLKPSKDETPSKIQNIDSTTDNGKAKDEKDNVSKVDSNVDTKVVTKDDQDGIKK